MKTYALQVEVWASEGFFPGVDNAFSKGFQESTLVIIY